MTKFEKIKRKTAVGWAYQPNKKLIYHPELTRKSVELVKRDFLFLLGVSGSGHRQGARAMKCAAFTLAETLITLAIIGIVAILTLPTLIAKYQKQVWLTSLRTVVSETSQALQLYMVNNDATNLSAAGFTSQENVNTFVVTYFKKIKLCSKEKAHECFAPKYKKINGDVEDEVVSSRFANSNSYILSNGTALRFNYQLSGEKVINLHIDVNGRKGPNTFGRDRFGIFIYNNGLLDDINGESGNSLSNAPLTYEERENSFNVYCINNGTGGCFGKILNDGWKMNY